MINEEQEKIIRDNLRIAFDTHVKRALKNMVRKISLDTKNDLTKLLNTDEKEVLINAKLYLDDFVEIFNKDLETTLENFIKEY